MPSFLECERKEVSDELDCVEVQLWGVYRVAMFEPFKRRSECEVLRLVPHTVSGACKCRSDRGCLLSLRDIKRNCS